MQSSITNQGNNTMSQTNTDTGIDMKKYTGTVLVMATPMSLGEYNVYRSWDLPADEDPNEEGYLVEDTTVGTEPNDNRHAGYITWIPKNLFNTAYKPTGTPHERVVVEQAKLQADIDALDAMLSKDRPDFISWNQWEQMTFQLEHMMQYNRILQNRLFLFSEEAKKNK